jgi:primosomal protein N'
VTAQGANPKIGGRYLRVAVDLPLAAVFDYLPPGADLQSGPERSPKPAPATIAIGTRVLVPFGPGQRVGMVLGETTRAASSP